MSENNGQKSEPSSVILYCRVCKRGFNSAGALGGHMRSHGAAGENNNRNYGEQVSEPKYTINNFRRDKSESQKHSYNLRTNSNRLVAGNNRSTSDDRVDVEKSEYYYGRDGKEKQHSSREEEDLANCLVMLSSKSCDLSDDNNNSESRNKAKEVEKGMFQCKACKKVFNSHQALGGHRASHKKVKGCYAAKLDVDDDDTTNSNNDDNDIDEDLMISTGDLILHQESNSSQSQSPSSSSFSRKRSRVHQCSICQRVFSSGQALGGHKRCHWLTSSIPETTFIPSFQEIQYHNQEQVLYNKPIFTNHHQPLDLNFPAQLGNPAEVGLKLHSNPFEQESPKSSLQLWTDQQVDINQNENQNHKCKYSLSREEDIKSKEAKLSNLKDVNLDGGSSWLQIGIGPTPDILPTL
ncbi:putative feruloyl CoA ortho-hydroxylase 1-like [Capsicum annuum]|nr:zinc finger protein ZAT9-like [Capsicum annuum]KAF3666942.1 putative feruloyl CoA ortho-hydroxylase 1-like [Capsicum annuum]